MTAEPVPLRRNRWYRLRGGGYLHTGDGRHVNGEILSAEWYVDGDGPRRWKGFRDPSGLADIEDVYLAEKCDLQDAISDLGVKCPAAVHRINRHFKAIRDSTAALIELLSEDDEP